MDKKVILSITGSQYNMNGEDNSVNFITTGRLYKKDGSYVIEYEESATSDGTSTVAIISIDGDSVVFKRNEDQDSQNVQFVFEKGKRFSNLISTPFGIQEIGIYSSEVDFSLSENSGSLNLKYQLNIGDKYTTANLFTLQYEDNFGNMRIKSKLQ